MQPDHELPEPAGSENSCLPHLPGSRAGLPDDTLLAQLLAHFGLLLRRHMPTRRRLFIGQRGFRFALGLKRQTQFETALLARRLALRCRRLGLRQRIRADGRHQREPEPFVHGARITRQGRYLADFHQNANVPIPPEL